MTGDSGSLTLHLEKVLQARTGRVFEACVERGKLAEWWGPAGFTSPSLALARSPTGDTVAQGWAA